MVAYPLLVDTLSLFLASILLFSGISKIRNRQNFTVAIIGHNIVGHNMADIAAITMIAGELVSGLSLLFADLRVFGLFTAATLFMTYAAVVFFNLARGNIRIDCGCSWGASSLGTSALTVYHAIRPVLLAAMASAILLSIQPGESQSLADGIVGAIIALPLLALYVVADKLIENWAQFRGEML